MTDGSRKYVNDLGIAAYVLMHGFAVVGKHGRQIYFECENQSAAETFDKLVLEYQPPNDYYTFDSCLMFLKKINDVNPPSLFGNVKAVNDLGVAAYLVMLEYRENSLGVKIVGKSGRNVYFSHPEGKGNEFERLSYQYLSSQFQTYDANLMALKKMPDRSQ